MAATNRNRDTLKSLVEGFSIEDWSKAEQRLKDSWIQPQPPKSITVEQYAQLTGKSLPRARKLLNEMRVAGLATSQKWRNGNTGTRNVYFWKK